MQYSREYFDNVVKYEATGDNELLGKLTNR